MARKRGNIELVQFIDDYDHAVLLSSSSCVFIFLLSTYNPIDGEASKAEMRSSSLLFWSIFQFVAGTRRTFFVFNYRVPLFCILLRLRILCISVLSQNGSLLKWETEKFVMNCWYEWEVCFGDNSLLFSSCCVSCCLQNVSDIFSLVETLLSFSRWCLIFWSSLERTDLFARDWQDSSQGCERTFSTYSNSYFLSSLQ